MIHDAQVARQLHLELKGERYREDEELARKLAAEFNLDHKMQRSTDEELALQLTREELVNDSNYIIIIPYTITLLVGYGCH